MNIQEKINLIKGVASLNQLFTLAIEGSKPLHAITEIGRLNDHFEDKLELAKLVVFDEVMAKKTMAEIDKNLNVVFDGMNSAIMIRDFLFKENLTLSKVYIHEKKSKFTVSYFVKKVQGAIFVMDIADSKAYINYKNDKVLELVTMMAKDMKLTVIESFKKTDVKSKVDVKKEEKATVIKQTDPAAKKEEVAFTEPIQIVEKVDLETLYKYVNEKSVRNLDDLSMPDKAHVMSRVAKALKSAETTLEGKRKEKLLNPKDKYGFSKNLFKDKDNFILPNGKKFIVFTSKAGGAFNFTASMTEADAWVKSLEVQVPENKETKAA